MERKSSIFDRLGGHPAIEAAVVKFYGRVLTDPLLSHFFDPTRVDVLKRSQIAFMTMAFGGPHEYSGKDLQAAHAGLVRQGLSDKHFDVVMWHLEQVLAELAVQEDLIEEVLALVETTRDHVLCRPRHH